MLTNVERYKNKTTIMICLLHLFVMSKTEDVSEITRDYLGDIFTLNELICNKSSCDRDGRQAAEILGEPCRCQCAPSHYTFREDRNECVKDVGDCPMALFVRPFSMERIPLIFLPAQGQLVYPGAHITTSGMAALTSSKFLSCKVKKNEYMTNKGWKPIKSEDDKQLFGVTYDGNKTFLKWLGNDKERLNLQHKLVLIRLLCGSRVSSEIFKPCVGLRIGWTRAIGETSQAEGNKKNSFIIIGLCLGVLGLTYVLAFFIYLKLRRRPSKNHNNLTINRNIQSEILDGDASQAIKSRDKGNRCIEKLEDKVIRTERQNPNFDGLSGSKSSHSAGDFLIRLRGMIRGAKQHFTSMRSRSKLLNVPDDNIFEASYKAKDEVLDNKLYCRIVTENGENRYKSRMEAVYNVPIDAISERSYIHSFQSNQRTLDNCAREKDDLDHVSSLEENKFDLFRRDLYEKIRQIHEKEINHLKVVKEQPTTNCSSQICKGCNRQISLGYSPILEENRKLYEKDMKNSKIFTPLSEELKEEKMTEKEILRNGSIYKNSLIAQASANRLSLKSPSRYRDKNKKSSKLFQETLSKEDRRSESISDTSLLYSKEVSPEKNEFKTYHNSDALSYSEDDAIDPDQFFQLSSQIAQKLSASSVPNFNCHSDRQTRSFGHFWKDLRCSLDKLRDRLDTKTASMESLPTNNDNWMLKKSDSPTNRLGKLVRRISFKRNDTFKMFRSDKMNKSCDSLAELTIINSNQTDEISECKNEHCEDGIANTAFINEVSVKNDEEIQIENAKDSKELNTQTLKAQQPPPQTILEVKENGETLNKELEKADTQQKVNTETECFEIQKTETVIELNDNSEHNSSFTEVSISTSSEDDELTNCESSVTNSEIISSKSSSRKTVIALQQSFDSDTLSMSFSDMTEDSLNTQGYLSNKESIIEQIDNPIDTCVNQLSDTVVDSNGKILRGGRATKGFDISEYFRTAGWEHVCQEKTKRKTKQRCKNTTENQIKIECTEKNDRDDEAVLLKRDQCMTPHHEAVTPKDSLEISKETPKYRENEVVKMSSSDDEHLISDASKKCSKIKRRRVSLKRKKRDNGCKSHIRNKKLTKRLETPVVNKDRTHSDVKYAKKHSSSA